MGGFQCDFGRKYTRSTWPIDEKKVFRQTVIGGFNKL
jgi:hypothetical protein